MTKYFCKKIKKNAILHAECGILLHIIGRKRCHFLVFEGLNHGPEVLLKSLRTARCGELYQIRDVVTIEEIELVLCGAQPEVHITGQTIRLNLAQILFALREIDGVRHLALCLVRHGFIQEILKELDALHQIHLRLVILVYGHHREKALGGDDSGGLLVGIQVCARGISVEFFRYLKAEAHVAILLCKAETENA